MEFFNNETASLLQYCSFPLELIGLSLAAVEVRFPVLASSIDGYFRDRVTNPGPSMSDEIRRLGIVRFIGTGIVGIYVIALIFALLIWLSLELSFILSLGIGLLTATVLALGMFFIQRVFEWFMRLSSGWVVGRSVGTLGIIIAGFGLLGEAYQFTTQLVI